MFYFVNKESDGTQKKIKAEKKKIRKRDKQYTQSGSGCGSVGRAVASDTRGPRFESSHWQKIIHIEHLFTVNCELKRQK